MLVRQHTQHMSEMVKWMILLALASALMLAFATSTASGADLPPPEKSPGLLPGEIEEWSSPMPTVTDETTPATRDVSMDVWEALDAQYHEDYEAAIVTWNKVQMPRDTHVWKYVALGQAYLATGEIDEASRALGMAESLRPDNALVHYYIAVLRLEQACLAHDWFDATGPSGTVLIAYRVPDVSPNTKAMYKMAAIMELETALKNAPDVWLEERLVPAEWVTNAEVEPVVSDLLLAMKAENYVAQAHSTLGSLYLEKGSLELAEQHMDSAVSGGVSVLYEYSELAKEYEADGRHGDALRAYLKAAQQEPEKTTPLRNAWENLKRALL